MNTELESRLRADMERATQGVRVPPGLALKAYQRHRRRTMTTRAVTAVGAAAVVAAGTLTVAGVTGAFGRSAGGQQVQTDAYVISRVERALSTPAMNNVVAYTRTAYPAGMTLRPVPGGSNGSGRPGTSPHGGDYALAWAYHHTSSLSAFTATGRRLFDERLTVANGSLATTAVNYASHTWWTATQPGPARTGPKAAGCLPSGDIRLGGGADAWPAFIRSQLACGAYTVVGKAAVGGVRAVKITATSGHFTLWVNPATYLPMRLDLGPLTGTFQWLPPTPANLAHLNAHVPASFHQVPPPS